MPAQHLDQVDCDSSAQHGEVAQITPESITLRSATETHKMHEGEVLPAVMSVAEVSAKEFGIEKMLDKMLGLWQVIMPAQHLDCVDYASSACRSALLQPMEYGVLEYRDTGTYIIRGTDEINTLLDDHIVATQAMSFSPYKKVRAIIVVPLYMEHPYWSCYYSSSPRSRRQVFEERIMDWEKHLKLVQVR
jgi:hypothetical protein